MKIISIIGLWIIAMNGCCKGAENKSIELITGTDGGGIIHYNPSDLKSFFVQIGLSNYEEFNKFEFENEKVKKVTIIRRYYNWNQKKQILKAEETVNIVTLIYDANGKNAPQYFSLVENSSFKNIPDFKSLEKEGQFFRNQLKKNPKVIDIEDKIKNGF